MVLFMNNNWLRACLLKHGLTEKETNKVLLSKDNIVSVLKDIILDAYDIINDMEEHEYNIQPEYESLNNDEKYNVVNIKEWRH